MADEGKDAAGQNWPVALRASRPLFQGMKCFLIPCVLLLAAMTPGLRAAEPLPVEQQVADAVKSPGVTVVHFWAPWCPNCLSELSKNGWSRFIAANPNVNFVFVTIWSDEEGRAVLAKNGVGAQKNFQLLLHPNHSRIEGEMMKSFLDLPVTWTPTTWVFRNGRLRYAFNYGELRFPMLQQILRDTVDKWDR
jgi:thiol-disulfide isomerase/thioredoxin